MNYVIAGYTIVLSILFLYGLQLAWRRRRLTAAAVRLSSVAAESGSGSGPVGAAGSGSGTTERDWVDEVDEVGTSR